MPLVSAQPPRLHALVPCAGTGARAGSELAKQYVVIAGGPMVAHTLLALAGVRRLASILVVVAPDDTEFDRLVSPLRLPSVTSANVGGTTRAASVAAGLAQLAGTGADPADWVLVHDAARCLVRSAWIDALIDACEDDAVGGLLGVPVADTLKRGEDGRAVATVTRAGLWQAQTPQMFRLGTLIEALARAGADVTDEAGAIEAIGLAPRLVAAPAENFKVTHGADFAVAAALLEARRT